MKIGIYAGTIPPPVFINNLINGLADKGDIVFIYGKVIEKKYKFSNSGIIQRKFPTTQIGIFLYSIYALSKLIIMQPQLYLIIVKMLRQNSTNWIQFLKRSCRVLPPFLDNLDIFHIQWAKTLVQYPEFIEKLTSPVVLSLRGAHINYSPLADKQLAQGYKKYFPMVAGFHAVSDAIAREAEKYAAESSKITVIRPAVKRELLNYVSSKKTNGPEELLQIISVGRCHWKKGYTFALDAMAILKKEGLGFHYTLIAGGSDNENIHYQVYDLGLSDCVNFMNGLPHNEVMNKLSVSDLFLLSSLEEGISNAVLEAMALGIPTISTDCGGMREVICDKKNGFIIPFREPVMMAKKIKEFSSMNETERRYISENARKTILEKYLLNEQINEMVNLYQNVLKYN